MLFVANFHLFFPIIAAIMGLSNDIVQSGSLDLVIFTQ